MMNTGIYEIVNTINGKRYVGSAINLRKRWREHLRTLKKGEHHSCVLQRAWDKYGETAFQFNLLIICDQSDLLMYEQRALDIIKPEYNIAPIAGSSLGIIRSKETREKIAAFYRGKQPPHLIGYKHTSKTKDKIRKGHLGKPCPQSARDKLREVNTGKILSSEHRAKISATNKKRWVDTPEKFYRRTKGDSL